MEQGNHTCYAAVKVNTKIQIFKQGRPSRVTKRGITAKMERIIQQRTRGCLKFALKVERITNIQKDFINSIRYQKRNLKLIIGGPGRSSGVGNSNL